MMTEEEGWITYGLEAIEHVLEKGILHVETIQRSYSHHATHSSRSCTHHFQKLTCDREATLELLRDLMFKTNLSEYQDILGYLYY